MSDKKLTLTLLEDIPFKDLLSKIEKSFNVSTICKNQDGRLIAESMLEDYSISIIDRYDDLADFLCDKNHTLEFTIKYDNLFNFEIHEKRILELLKDKIKWENSIWSPSKLGGPYRRLNPNGEVEIFHR